MDVTLQDLINLAKDMEQPGDIKWDELSIDKESVYNMLALGVVDEVNSIAPHRRELVLYVSLLKLTVENFVLQLRLGDNL
jgi:hypothetical protein